MQDFLQSLSNVCTKKSWHRIGLHQHHGINVPLFALRTAKSSGLGEFLDLYLLIDWCSSIGFDIIQLLPLNDTGFESSPYNAISSTALNPIFLSLWALPYLDKYEELRDELVKFRKYKPLQRIAYEAVLNAKLDFLGKYFQKTFPLFRSDPGFVEFQKKHLWLKDYSLFKSLKDKYAHQGWSRWHPEIRNPSPSLLESLYKEHEEKMNFFTLLQYLCFEQLKSVKKYANEKNIFLKGDIPILISPESQDVWIFRKDFNLDYSAGSPPDMFTTEGQNWGFPIYRWDVVASDDFRWWNTRLQVASEFYDIYRIDHIIGFYRIWGIIRGESAIHGQFIPPDQLSAKIQGEMVLKKLTSFTDMLPIGEDLGADIDYIRESLLQLGIPGTKVPRWEKYRNTTHEFIPFNNYPKLSLTTLSTHDSDTLRQWWENNPSEAAAYAKLLHIPYQQTLNPEIRYKILKESHKTPSLFHINLLNEYLGIFEDLSWPNPNDDRINVPATISPSNWCYRLRPTLEDMIAHNDLKHTMRSLIN